MWSETSNIVEFLLYIVTSRRPTRDRGLMGDFGLLLSGTRAASHHCHFALTGEDAPPGRPVVP